MVSANTPGGSLIQIHEQRYTGEPGGATDFATGLLRLPPYPFKVAPLRPFYWVDGRNLATPRAIHVCTAFFGWGSTL